MKQELGQRRIRQIQREIRELLFDQTIVVERAYVRGGWPHYTALVILQGSEESIWYDYRAGRLVEEPRAGR